MIFPAVFDLQMMNSVETRLFTGLRSPLLLFKEESSPTDFYSCLLGDSLGRSCSGALRRCSDIFRATGGFLFGFQRLSDETLQELIIRLIQRKEENLQSRRDERFGL